MKTTRLKSRGYCRRRLPELFALAALLTWTMPSLRAQTAAPSQDDTNANKKADGIVTLSPFEVVGAKDTGYAATSSLAGSRLNTALRDVASAISVVTPEFLKDTGATDLQHILIYQTNMEAAGIGGNFYGGDASNDSLRIARSVNPDSGTRVRGLDTADRTRDFFPTGIPVDTYNMARMDIQRGPNSILFGLGSPAGIINETLKDPNLRKLGLEAQFRVGTYGSLRGVLDVNVPLLKDTLGLRVIGLDEKEKYRQDFTFEHDKRVYAAARWQPVLGDHVYTQIDVKVESGQIDANRPVPITPADYISNWFGPLHRYLAYDPLTDNGTPIGPDGVRHTELSHYFAGAPARDWWNDSPATIFQNPDAGTIGNGHVDAYRQRDGVPWGGLSGVTNVNLDEGGTGTWNKNTAAYFANNPIVTEIINQYQTATGNTFSGFGSSQWPSQNILGGPLAFVDKTLYGPNKKEWNNFDTINVAVTQTYLDGRLGFNAAYDKQSYRYGQAAAINPTNYRVTVDVNTTLRDGSPNPDVGRPVVIAPSGGSMTQETREGFRGTGFYKFNISDYVGKDAVLSKIFGEQTFTGVYSSQRFTNFSRNFNLYNWDAQTYIGTFNGSDPRYRSWWGSHYLGSSLRDVASFNDIPASAIQGVTAIQTPGATSNTIVFDARPGDTLNTWHTASITTNSWLTDINKLYTGASQGYDETKSKSFVWQGRLFNDALIPLFGWREDHYTRWDKPGTLPQDPVTGVVLPYSPLWNFTGTAPINVTEQRRSWGWVLHTKPILDLFHYELPKGIDLSFTYNDSNSFRPSEVAADIMGNKLPSPSGTTRDKGFLLTVLDNKFSLRMTWYKTIQKGTTMDDPSGMIQWAKNGMVRNINAMAQEAWGPSARTNNQTTPEWLVNKWMFGNTTTAAPIPADWQTAWSPAQLNAALAGPLPLRRAADPTDPSYIAQGTTYIPDGATAAIPYIAPPLAADEMTFRQAWFAARTDAQWFGPLDPAWVQAEGFKKITGDDYRIWGEGGTIANEKLTNDLITKGVEIELTANPTPNWRLAFNASRNTAVRTNILTDWADFIAKNKDIWFDGYNDTPESELSYWTVTGFADIRHWTGNTYGTDNTGNRMMGNVYGPYQNAVAKDGQMVNELRKWRWNLVSNYTFSRGFLKGFNIGGGVRWQDKVAIGYYPKYNADAAIWVTDVTKPIYAPSETNYDAWIGYERKLTKGITWIVQLNAYDLFAKSSLIPIMANPDGTIAQVRIPSQTTVSLTNTFRF
jgi:outer membrane receptor protein involved in Fe transport